MLRYEPTSLELLQAEQALTRFVSRVLTLPKDDVCKLKARIKVLRYTSLLKKLVDKEVE